jgi:putative DNA primase/helicase
VVLPAGVGFQGTDNELIDFARGRRNGQKFIALFDQGDTSGYGDDESRADLALCSLLAFLSGPDPPRIERIFSMAKLGQREKWRTRADYRERTIARSLDGRTEFYMAKKRRQSPSSTGPNAPPGQSPEKFIFDPGEPLATARAFLHHRFLHDQIRTLHYYQSEFFRWDGVRYELAENEAIRKAIYEFLEPAWQSKHTPDGGEILIPFKPNISKVNNVQDALHAATLLAATTVVPAWLGDPHPIPATELVAAQNGLIHLGTGRVLEHTPLFFSTHALPFFFNPRAPAPTEWRRFMAQLWQDDAESIETLQEWIGYTLTPDTSQQKILLLIGPMRSGKGTIARIWTRLLGIEAVAAPTLASLETNFGLWPLIGKALAIISDARLSGRPDQAKIVERLLSISGEDAQTIDRKHKEPWTGRLGVRIVMLTNELPRLADASGAMAGRFIILRLTKSFYGSEDTGLEGRLAGELSSIFNWAMEGRRRLHERGRFIQPESAMADVQDLRELSSPITAFITEGCETGVGYQESIAGLYAAWCRWCSTQGRDHTGDIQTFGKNLKAAVQGIRETRLRINGERPRFYTGIRLATGGPRSSATQPIAREGGGLPV